MQNYLADPQEEQDASVRLWPAKRVRQAPIKDVQLAEDDH